MTEETSADDKRSAWTGPSTGATSSTASRSASGRWDAASPAGLWRQPPPAWPQDRPDYYPPMLTGMRGSHPGSLRERPRPARRRFLVGHTALGDTGETYDLVVVGGGISGLAAAYFYRAARPDARILILDNHDDFGGHAKRNEFHLDGKLHLLNGGTLEIDSPYPYSPAADGLLKALGIDPPALAKACDRDEVYPALGLRHGVFFDKETFGVDRLGRRRARPATYGPGGSWPEFLARTPLSDAGQRRRPAGRDRRRSTTCPA